MKLVKLRNFEDHECVWGYVTLCQKCASEHHFTQDTELKEYFPGDTCEYCKRKGMIVKHTDPW